jgi:hypothetical protein
MPQAMCDGDPHLRGGLGRTGDGYEAGLALDEKIVGLLVPVGARGTVAGNVANDEPGMPLPKDLRAEAEPTGRARRQVLYEDIGLLDELTQYLLRPFLL